MHRSLEQAIRSAVLAAMAVLMVPWPAAGASAPCVTVTTEAIYRNYGYDHIVHLSSGCAGTVTCVVTTDVSPEPQRVTLEPKGHADVLTFRGSPARAFTAHADCH
jgi:hypothetical protein